MVRGGGGEVFNYSPEKGGFIRGGGLFERGD